MTTEERQQAREAAGVEVAAPAKREPRWPYVIGAIVVVAWAILSVPSTLGAARGDVQGAGVGPGVGYMFSYALGAGLIPVGLVWGVLFMLSKRRRAGGPGWKYLALLVGLWSLPYLAFLALVALG